ncbi:MAG TPA: ATP-binding protein [Actinomycetota bacterium]|nr:ATP-binding protein [Actinomycetota bacterium]
MSTPRWVRPEGAQTGEREERRSALSLATLGAKTRARRIAGYAIAILGTAGLTLILLPFRDNLVPLSKGFGFLVVVVAAAAVGGLGPGIVASVVGFIVFNFFFLPPYNTFTVARPEYVAVLFVFLGISILISALLARATDRAEAAEAREAELRTLQELSADLVTSLPGRDTYARVLRRIIQVFAFDAATLHFDERLFGDATEPVTVGAAEPVPLQWDPASEGRAPERLPLTVGGRSLGLIAMTGDRPPLDPRESRVLRAFCDQLALILEDERLLRTATQVEVYRQTEEMRRSLLAAVSHDLRSPLAAIKASVTDLLDDDAQHSADEVRAALEAVDDQTDRLNALVANLLDMSRIEAGMLRSRSHTLDLEEILVASADRVGEQRPGVHVQVTVAPGAALVRADPVFLERVVVNLLENAVTASSKPTTREVQLDARRSDDDVIIRVIDHGEGVPPNIRELLFYPFYSLERRGARLGTGLGLAICKGLVAVMDGQIWIEDTPGGGATFAFSLPSPVPAGDPPMPLPHPQEAGARNAGPPD